MTGIASFHESRTQMESTSTGTPGIPDRADGRQALR